MIKPKSVIRQNRKTLSITINQKGELIVKAPKGLADSEINKFIAEKEYWIVTKLNKVKENSLINGDLVDYKAFLLFGNKYQSVIDPQAKSASFVAGKCYIPDLIDQSQRLHKVILIYKRLAEKWLRQRTLEIAKIIKANFDEFKISDTKGRWGCCTSNYCINLNWRVVCLKPELIDYVIVHELCHLKEMNHSPKFWSEVQRILPDYKKRRKQVKEMSFLFQIYKDN